jgi:small subunit ribosomal protein S6
MQIYESIFILQPELTEEEMESIVGTFEQVLTDQGATLQKTEKWGKKRLAYCVRKYWEGFYILLEFTASSEALAEFERRLRIHEHVIKWLSVRKDPRAAAEEERRAARMARARPEVREGEGEPRPSETPERVVPVGEKIEPVADAAPVSSPGAGKDETQDEGEDSVEVAEPADTAEQEPEEAKA